MMRLAIYAAIVAASIGVTLFALNKAYQAGRSAEQGKLVERIEKENRDAGAVSEDWRGKFRRCRDAGGLFDFESGSCEP